jgi:hypothetical protein
MMKKIVLFILTVLVMLAIVSPATAEEEVTLEIRNLTQSQVTLRLNGPTDLRLTITRNLTKVRVEPGTYDYRYKACGVNRSGTFTVTVTGGTLLLKKCEKDLNGQLNIVNLTGKAFTLRMSGPTNYRLTINPGINRLTLEAGRYDFEAKPVCGTTETGMRGIKSGKRNPDWTFEVCD